MVLVGRNHPDAKRLRWRAILLALVGWVMLASPLRAQISPGPLASAHVSLEGPVQCVKCHGNRRDAMVGQCLSCHKDIGWLTERNRGFHGGATVKGTSCASCHPDHAGKEFKMVQWPDGSPVCSRPSIAACTSRFTAAASSGWMRELHEST